MQLNSHFQVSSTAMSANYSVRTVGQPNTLQYRVHVEQDGLPISSFHDIPLYADRAKSVLNMVVEVPRWTNNKFEVRDKSWVGTLKDC